jgi:MOSC domain-containing protein YiiM
MLAAGNLDGDRQADLRVHGGPDRAVLVYGAEHYAEWATELGRELPYGSFGENFTVTGWDNATANLGDIYQVGPAIIQLTQHRGPCYKLQYRTEVPDMIERVLASGRGGIYARVLQVGLVQVGDEVELLRRG